MWHKYPLKSEDIIIESKNNYSFSGKPKVEIKSKCAVKMREGRMKKEKGEGGRKIKRYFSHSLLNTLEERLAKFK
jgi:hypothetical protein